MKERRIAILFLALLFNGALSAQTGQNPATDNCAIDRALLPVREPQRITYSELDVCNAKAPAGFDINAPKAAPNLVIVLIDGMGFGVSGAFGGPIPIPPLDRQATNGLRYNRLHTTALCAPTRVALFSGYNHHSNNMGVIS